MPTIQEFADYGVRPGVLVAILVVGCYFVVTSILKFTQWLFMWHEQQMTRERDLHMRNLERVHSRMDQLSEAVNKILTFLQK